MKKNFFKTSKIFVVALLIASIALTLCACGADGTTPTTAISKETVEEKVESAKEKVDSAKEKVTEAETKEGVDFGSILDSSEEGSDEGTLNILGIISSLASGSGIDLGLEDILTDAEEKVDSAKEKVSNVKDNVDSAKDKAADTKEKAESAKESIQEKAADAPKTGEELGQNIRDIITNAADEQWVVIKGQFQDTINLLLGQLISILMGCVDKAGDTLELILQELQSYFMGMVVGWFN